MKSNNVSEIFDTSVTDPDPDQEIINGLHLATNNASKEITYPGMIKDD